MAIIVLGTSLGLVMEHLIFLFAVFLSGWVLVAEAMIKAYYPPRLWD